MEDQGSLVGRGEQAVRGLFRSGERPLDVSEQLASEQFLVEGGAVLGDERSFRSSALGMDGCGGHVFARAALAGDKHRHIGGSHFFDEKADLVGGSGVADELGRRLAPFGFGVAQESVLPLQPDPLVGVLDDHLHPVQGERFGQVVVGADPHGLHGRLDVSVAGDHDHGHVGQGLLEVDQQVHAAHVRELDVKDDDVERMVPYPGQGFRCGAGRGDLAAGSLELLFEEFADA